jgi:hypothetical protein
MNEEIVESNEVDEAHRIQVGTNPTGDWGFPNDYHIYVLNTHDDWDSAFREVAKFDILRNYLILDNNRYLLSCAEDLPVDGEIIVEKIR